MPQRVGALRIYSLVGATLYRMLFFWTCSPSPLWRGCLGRTGGFGPRLMCFSFGLETLISPLRLDRGLRLMLLHAPLSVGQKSQLPCPIARWEGPPRFDGQFRSGIQLGQWCLSLWSWTPFPGCQSVVRFRTGSPRLRWLWLIFQQTFRRLRGWFVKTSESGVGSFSSGAFSLPPTSLLTSF